MCTSARRFFSDCLLQKYILIIKYVCLGHKKLLPVKEVSSKVECSGSVRREGVLTLCTGVGPYFE